MAINVSKLVSRLTNLYEYAECIQRDGAVYIDNHCDREMSLSKINICFYRPQHTNRFTNAWIFPGGYNCCQSKNALEIENGQLHLSCRSQGFLLQNHQQTLLAAGQPVSVTGGIPDFIRTEVVVQISVEEFLKLAFIKRMIPDSAQLNSAAD